MIYRVLRAPFGHGKSEESSGSVFLEYGNPFPSIIYIHIDGLYSVYMLSFFHLSGELDL